jgi:hypothetical protein
MTVKLSDDDLRFIKELTTDEKPVIWPNNLYELLKYKARK